MVLYSKVVTIRDKQLEEAKILEKEYYQEQQKLDLMMEIERLKLVKLEEDRDNERALARKRGQEVILQQIAEKGNQRIREYELKERESKMIKKNVDLLLEEERKATEIKKQRVLTLQRQVEESNRAN